MQTQARECSRNGEAHIAFNLLIQSNAVSGPGLLTVSAVDFPLEASVYVVLTGYYTRVDLGQVTLRQHSHSDLHPSSYSSALQSSKASTHTSSAISCNSMLSVSQALPFGAAVQLSKSRHPGMSMHNYAVSEAFLVELLDISTSKDKHQAYTPYTDSLPYILSLYSQTLPTCSPTFHKSTGQSQPTANQPPRLDISQAQPAYTQLPWLLCIMLLCSTLALALKHVGNCQTCTSVSPEASSLETENGFCIRSKVPLITPMKDMGCSPFVPVTQAAMPPPMGPYHLPPTCSSKIGSYRTPRGAKPTASRAVTNQTNTSGRTKWQRDRNGRLASLATQETDSNLDEFTSSRAKRRPEFS